MRWANENLGRGPEALGPARADIEELDDQVHRYTATLHTSVSFLPVPPSGNDAQMAKVCTVSFRPNEVELAQKVVGHLSKIQQRIGDVAKRASDRAASDLHAAQLAAQQSGEGMASAAALPNNGSGVRGFAGEISQNTSIQIFYEQNLVLISRRSNELKAIVNGMIEEMNGDIALLNSTQDAFVIANRRCVDWQVGMENRR